MQADLFYESLNDKAIPLFLMSENQQEKEAGRLSAAERNCLAVHQFKGKLGDHCLIYNADGVVEKAYIGTGSGNQGPALAHAAQLLPVGSYQLQEQLTQEAAVAWGLAQYRFIAYKHYEVQPRLLVVNQEQLKNILPLTQSIYLVRDLVNTPTNDMGPKELADVVEQLAQTHQAEFKQWIGEELLTHNFPAIHAVGRASASAPRLLSLTWGNGKHPRITLVGKGVCFDSGGLDIKPASGMRLMKKDMGGAAHVIGLAQWIMDCNLPVRLQVLIPAVENSIGPNAFRPGDILTMRNGLTVEIENTDAEGRLILADALVKACEEQPELIINFATLTGAARVAVGPEIAAMFSNNDQLASELVDLSYKIGDPVWRLPLFTAYEDLLHSTIADVVNSSSSPYAGAIIAALFLQRFIAQSLSWVHFDVMAWNINSKPGKPEGGEAMGLRTVAEYLLRVYGKSS
jgi:leucyl aminopeptidase